MREPLQLREAATPITLVMVRFGRTTLADDKLRQNCEVTFARWGCTASLCSSFPAETTSVSRA